MSSSPAFSRQEYLFKGAPLARLRQFVQRNRLFERERPGLGPPQHGDMADGAERLGDVAGQAADIGALGNAGGKGRLMFGSRQQG